MNEDDSFLARWILLKIAICEDDERFQRILQRRIMDFFQVYFPTFPFQLEVFPDGIALIDSMERGQSFELVFLDWGMPLLDGGETGKAIRHYDPECLIVFVTSHAEYALQSTKLTTFRYILKDRLDLDLAEALNEAVRNRTYRERMLLFRTTEHSEVQLRLKDIQSIEHQSRRIVLHTRDCAFTAVSGWSLKPYKSMLQENGFIECLRGVLVNVREIQEVLSMDLLMRGGKKVPLSRSYRTAVLGAIRARLEG